MSRRNSDSTEHPGLIDLDVLIVGGGAQGLWLLQDLNQHGYRTVLLEERELGGRQTCHSHALVHRGHYYDDISMMIVLNAAAQFWEAFASRTELSRLNEGRALVGFGPGVAVNLHRYMWDSAGLQYTARPDLPPFLQGGKVRHLFETQEFSLDASKVVSALAEPVLHCIYKVDEGSVRLQRSGRKIQTVAAHIAGSPVNFRPRTVIIAAGQNSLALLEQVDLHRNPVKSDGLVQARRNNHMLVLRSDNLPPLTAVFPIRGGLQGLFICSRRDAETGQVVWLASDHNSTPFDPGSSEGRLEAKPRSAQDAPNASQAWLDRMFLSLQALTPALFSRQTLLDLEYSLYTGLTSERNFGAGSHMTDCYVDPLGMQNLFAIWPTKLTLTPFASNIAVRLIKTQQERGTGPWSHVVEGLPSARPRVAPELWTRQPFSEPTSSRTGYVRYADAVAHASELD